MKQKALVFANDPAYGTERSYNAIRLAGALARTGDAHVRMFLFGDAVTCAVRGQRVPSGYYRLEAMIGSLVRRGGEVGCCGTCMDARGITDEMLVEGAWRSSLDEAADWTLWADKVVSF